MSKTEIVHKYIIPYEHEPAVQGVGVIGAISMQVGILVWFNWADGSSKDHPVIGMPTFFVHPCNTAVAMQEIAQDTNVRPEHYIRLWIGIVGGCVGLNVPAAVAAAWPGPLT